MEQVEKAGMGADRYDNLPRPLKILFLVFTIIGILLGVISTFGLSPGGYVLLDVTYYYILMALFTPFVFLILGASKKHKQARWYDFLASALTFGIAIYFALNGWNIRYIGWIPPSLLNFGFAFIFCLLTLEAARRFIGFAFLGVAIVVGIYPVFASHVPGILRGLSFSLVDSTALYVFGTEGMIGIPSRVIGNIVLGFLLFAAILIGSGAGDFFLDLAKALLGRFRGGPAKVAVLSSALIGSLTGDAVANVIATGSFTIPSMKKVGYSPHYAGAIEACASTGGCIMPPVMGAVIFIMCVFLSIDYSVAMIAATLPAILYYFGLLVQVDAYAARVGLKPLPKEEIPSLKATLKKGWMYIFAIFFLVWGFITMRWEYMTPYYASALLIILSFSTRNTKMTPKRMLKTLVLLGKLLSQMMAILLPLGIIIAAFMVTGGACSFSAGLVHSAQGNLWVALLMGVIACYLLGMAGMLAAAYVLLSVTLAPAIIAIGELNVMAVHLFIVYYAMISMITPPVAAAAFVGAAIAGAPPMKTAWTAMRLGVVIYFIPFFFICNPALILQGPLLESFYLFVLCLLGIVFIAAGCEGYLLKVGKVDLWARVPLVIAGFLIGIPGWTSTGIGAALAAGVIAVIWLRREKAPLPSS